MAIQLDHLIVPSHDPVAGAKSLAGLLDVPWQEAQGPFTPVYVNETLTLDFADRDQFEPHHYCFRVSDAEFDAILGRIRAARIVYRSSPLGETDMQINRRLGGKNLYWQDTDGHLWEILTVSYARAESPPLITPGRTPTTP
jgi:catechol 2,3-dioxygenase-like lactoylglutathione lyase family enzyme